MLVQHALQMPDVLEDEDLQILRKLLCSLQSQQSSVQSTKRAKEVRQSIKALKRAISTLEREITA